VLLALIAVPDAAANSAGGLTQLPGIDGCLSVAGASDLGAGTCQNARGIGLTGSIELSPDGNFAYSTSVTTGGYSIFKRDPATGTLSQLPGTAGCISSAGASEDGAGTCANGRATDAAGGYGPTFAFSPDGKFAYAAAAGANGLVAFSRDPGTGFLTQLPGNSGCITDDGSSEDGPGTCINGRAADADGLSISADGRNVYSSSAQGSPHGIAVFSRDSSSGVLTQLAGTDGCISPNGASEEGAGTCTNGKAVDYCNYTAITPDGKHAYSCADSNDGIAAFSRNTSTGKLTQLAGTDGCVTKDGSSEDGADTCANGRALVGVWMAQVSPDGKNLYAGLYDGYGLVAFAIDGASGRLTQLAGTDGCITSDGSSEDGAGTCQNGRGADSTWNMAIAPDGLNIYVGESSAGFTIYRRDLATGKATQLPGADGCLSKDGSSEDGAGTCTDTRGGNSGYEAAISPDGLFAYLASYADSTIGVFSRQLPPSCSDVKAKTNSTSGKVTVPLTCTDPNGNSLTRSIASQPAHGKIASINQSAGTAAYEPAKGYTGADSFRFQAGDGSDVLSNAATATLEDGLSPACTLRSSKAGFKSLRRNRYSARFKCSEAGKLTVELLVKRSAAKGLGIAKTKYTRIGRASVKVKSAGAVKVKLKLTAKARKRLRKAGKGRLGKAGLTLRVKTADASGNAGSKESRLKVR
jgi:DNA-binding beta-propeller fold protein YncE